MANLSEQKDQFDSWCDQWEKAMKDGVFEDAPKQTTTPVQTADVSYFGPTDTHPTTDIKDVDAQYWNQVYSMSRNSGDSPDPTLLHEEKNTQQISKIVNAMGQSPNPIRAPSVGMDQSMEPGPLGVTFGPEDIQEIADLKVKLHGLKDKLNTLEGKGQGDKKLESTIGSLQNKIDELSDALGKAFPREVLPQGD